MKTHSLLFTGLMTLTTSSIAQPPMKFCFTNSSMEGPALPHVVPGPWISCYATPDTQPGNWGIVQAPSDGISYVSFIRSGSGGFYNEGMSQVFNPWISPGTYVFTVDLAHSTIYTPGSDPLDCYSSLAIYGGNSACNQAELLWESGPYTHTSWKTYPVMVQPSSNWTHMTFCPQYHYNCGNGMINVMLDNITCIEPVEIVKPACDGSTPGTITIAPPSALSGAPFTYVWNSNPPTLSNTFTITGPGTYTVDISDTSGKTIHYEIKVNCD